MSPLKMSYLVRYLLFGLGCLLSMSSGKFSEGRHDLRPTIALSSLQLRVLCEEGELEKQLRPVRFAWLTCLGVRKLFLPTEVENTLGDMDRLKLAQMLALPYESLNPYCVLADRWRACSRHLAEVTCLIANVDAIESAGNPKYTPLHRPAVRWRRKRVSARAADTEYVPVPIGRPGEDIDRQHELFRLQCEAVRSQQHYRNSGHHHHHQQRQTASSSSPGAADSSSVASLATQFGHLFTVPGSEAEPLDTRALAKVAPARTSEL